MPQAKDVASGTLSRSSVIVQSIRTVRIDEKLDKHFCQGVLEIALSPRSIARLSTPEGQAALARSFDTRSVRIGESRATQDIRFTSRFGEDGKHFVEMGGFQGLAELAFRFTAPEVADQLSTSK